ncbi:septum formation initiator family protein [Helcococcus ovis]|uniref:Septum formation initiator family protein n=1 Tax=Helcococcus ovis TaxID=72026 RepID=A0A4R9C300_9FIRM|nr:septum formation initiator family protein [Helcococcus ovis]TFF64337.1 septum formation initiator family protein [Helcococcus ovis]TFF66471.1 septum formation initiator family protein [Helcococcus ovis]
MRKDVNSRKKIKRKFISDPRKVNIIFCISAIFLIVFLVIFIGQKRQIKQLKQNTNKLVTRQKELEDNISKLKTEIENSNSLEYIEKKAREDLGMIKKDEKIYTDDENSINTVPKESHDETKNETKKEN